MATVCAVRFAHFRDDTFQIHHRIFRALDDCANAGERIDARDHLLADRSPKHDIAANDQIGFRGRCGSAQEIEGGDLSRLQEFADGE